MSFDESILGQVLQGNQGPPLPSTNLSSTDSDCANDSPLGVITEPLCVAGKSILKGGGFLSDWRIWLVVAVVVILTLVAIIRGR